MTKKLTLKKVHHLATDPSVTKSEKQFEKETGLKVYLCQKCISVTIYRNTKDLRQWKESHKKQCKEKQKEAVKKLEGLMNNVK